MKYGVYSIFDKAAGIYTSPTIDISENSAARSFEQAVANSGSIMNFRPDDFALYQIGVFDVESGHIEPVVPPSWIISGTNVRKAGVTDNV